ncbi:hypothetical protein PILCRDRAFT_564242 [Piloderma croceum F 1598]|uniref:Uncharacterized protein n=1 Tax=Piloderma croceum (strain F 1598) TaxID=765440 RepID=A0A0C3FHQ2_PILCF|nr:hypothetical protein PILCRDRAFT_564242 [Piloderma croceum F 1598]
MVKRFFWPHHRMYKASTSGSQDSILGHMNSEALGSNAFFQLSSDCHTHHSVTGRQLELRLCFSIYIHWSALHISIAMNAPRSQEFRCIMIHGSSRLT